MQTHILTIILTVTGMLLISMEQVFSYTLFDYASTSGFILIVAGVLLLSFKVTKESKKVEAKYYDHFHADGGPAYSPGSKRHHANISDSGDTGGDFSAGGGDGA